MSEALYLVILHDHRRHVFPELTTDNPPPSSPQIITMVKALRFKGEKPLKKRKRAAAADDDTEASSSVAKRSAQSGEEEEGWTNTAVAPDLLGPLIFCFTTTSSAIITLASDAEGTVFASTLPAPPTSTPAEDADDEDAPPVVYDGPEPDTVQQVWTVGKIHGTEKYSIKSHTGRYLGCDKLGQLSATREAISPEEQWDIVPSPEGGEGSWGLQNCREKWVGVEDTGKVVIRGDREVLGVRETWWVRCQKRNKTRAVGKGADGGRVKDRVSRKELEEL